jgi:uncharacterized protein YkwD
MTRQIAAAILLALLSLAARHNLHEVQEALKPTKEEQELIGLTNAERKKAGLKPLVPNPQLTAAARGHAANMAKLDKLEHILDDKDFAARAKDAGYKYGLVGENIAYSQETPKDVVTVWMDSEPNKENILKGEYSEIGVAVAKNVQGERYWVQVFGTPLKP